MRFRFNASIGFEHAVLAGQIHGQPVASWLARKYLREEIIGLQKDEDWNPEDRVRYNTHLRELVESVSVALARSVASALLWNTDYRRACPLARRGDLGSPGEVRAAAPVGGGA